LLQILYQHLPGAVVGNQGKKKNVKIAGALAEIGIRYLPNTNLQHDHYTDLFGAKQLTWNQTFYVITSGPPVFATGFVYLKVSNCIILVLKPLIPTSDVSPY
jgi:hypothetical protein